MNRRELPDERHDQHKLHTARGRLTHVESRDQTEADDRQKSTISKTIYIIIRVESLTTYLSDSECEELID